MIRNTGARRRAAALAAGTLAAGALAVVPGMLGMSTASAATKTLNYDCTIPSSFGSQTLSDATLKLTVTNREVFELGAKVAADVTAELDVRQINLGPVVSRLSGNLDIALDVGGTATTVRVPVADWNKTTDPVTPVVLKAAKRTVELNAPAAAGAHNISVANVVGNLTGYVGTSPNGSAMTATCTPDAGQDLTISAAELDGTAYNAVCTIDMTDSGFGGKESFGADIAHRVVAPAKGQVGKAFVPTVTSTLTFGKSFRAYLKTSPVTKAKAAVSVDTKVGGKAVKAGTLSFAEWTRTYTPGAPPAPIGQDVAPFTLSGSGRLQSITPTAAGSLPITVAAVRGALTMTVSFGNVEMGAPIECTPKAAASAAVSVAPGTFSVKAPKVTGKAKVGKTVKVSAAKVSGAKVKYQWLANGKAVKKGTKAKLKLTKALRNKKVSVKVTYTKANYKTVVVKSKAVKVKK